MDAELDQALSGMILSASGWRGIFAEDGDAESSCRNISEAHRIIAAASAKVFSAYLQEKNGAVIVGRDTRPTGEAIANAVIRSLLSEGREVLYTGITAAPEIMAFTRANSALSGDCACCTAVAGFVYISASHNPIGHNGLKFGSTDGGVLQADENAKLVCLFREFIQGNIEPEFFEKADDEKLAGVFDAQDVCKKKALAAYNEFSAGVISDYADKTKSEKVLSLLREGLERQPIGIAVDFNGSARTVSIDRDFFSSLGVRFYSKNDLPGEIVHAIVPEGESLDVCRVFVEELHNKDPSVILGYMPDCDGDRGNLVIWDDEKKSARILESQEVFALAVVAELSFLAWTGKLKYDENGKALTKAALAINDPTSLRIDRIAEIFGVNVFRAEVGEANVVGLARKLREQGYLVRVLGEGPAGGTIIHPSAVRDPIDTLGAILKLLALRRGEESYGGMSSFGIWRSLSAQGESCPENFTLANVIATLPAFFTTEAYSADALLRVKTTDHGVLKNRYQKIFLRDWEEKKTALSGSYGISGWEAIAYNGTVEKRGITAFGESGRGGLKIEFNPVRESAVKKACVWMRGSGTEPVFRVMADAESLELERILIKWQRQMVLEADDANNKVE
jgi:phosphoglucomutase